MMSCGSQVERGREMEKQIEEEEKNERKADNGGKERAKDYEEEEKGLV